MNPNENEPLPTSIQSGAPAPMPEPVEEPFELRASSPLDRFLAELKSHERWGVALSIGVQFLVLAGMILWASGGR
jgi:hypothetical protein